MNDLYEAALEIQQFFLHRNWSFCIIGGLAVLRWGEPHATQDVDIALLTGFGDEESYVEAILQQFNARRPDADRFALENRVVLVSATNGRPVDIGLAAIQFEEQLIRRASPFAFTPDISLITCSAEDLVVLKAFAGRTKDWTALEGILVCRAGLLDWGYINEQLPPLCELKEDPDIPTRLAQLRKQLEHS